ncbi:Glycosyl hydrolases family 43 [Sedimentisphaera cyanobacteriorum]|uniref:Glycosyl hydrolases family 43 n=1 Tax=Sedimentisphaera cyanobacteriorum TaxID=1940790 RepID=A0A1Q2HRC3_9BACT|nr:family 43 glycosylhydrolase [Sedimentisphaera cyanobacteriorum]AQQ09972.1 Glycosyl hydrolases family 43 [Sedimentisphaera cyanobacteriorum]
MKILTLAAVLLTSAVFATVLRNADFENSLVWQGGKWSVSEGSIFQTSPNGLARALWPVNLPENYQITAELKKLEGSDGPMIIFRAEGFDKFYALNPAPNKSNGIFQFIDGKKIHNLTKNFNRVFSKQQWYRVKVVCRDNEFQSYLNGSKFSSVTIESPIISNNSVGIGSFDSSIEMRNFTVKDLEGNVLFYPSLEKEMSNITGWNLGGEGNAEVLREGANDSNCLFINSDSKLRLSQTGLRLDKANGYRLKMDYKAVDMVRLPKQIYLFVYYSWEGREGPKYAYSLDGMHWKKLNPEQPLFDPDVGEEKRFMDPSIIKGPEGRFHMVWTIGWDQHSIGIAHSDNLYEWSLQKALPVMAHKKGIQNCWSPEIFYDKKSGQYYIYWASSIKGGFPKTANTTPDGRNHRIFYTTTKDFITYSPAKLMFDNNTNVITPKIEQTRSGKYVMFVKNESRWPEEKNIRMMVSDDIENWDSPLSEPIHDTSFWAEGPSILKMGGCWYVFYEKYMASEFGAAKSCDLEKWQDISDEIFCPDSIRQGSFVRVSKKTFKNLAGKFHFGLSSPDNVAVSVKDGQIELFNAVLDNFKPEWNTFDDTFYSVYSTQDAVLSINIEGESQIWLDNISLEKLEQKQ